MHLASLHCGVVGSSLPNLLALSFTFTFSEGHYCCLFLIAPFILPMEISIILFFGFTTFYTILLDIETGAQRSKRCPRSREASTCLTESGVSCRTEGLRVQSSRCLKKQGGVLLLSHLMPFNQELVSSCLPLVGSRPAQSQPLFPVALPACLDICSPNSICP